MQRTLTIKEGLREVVYGLDQVAGGVEGSAGQFEPEVPPQILKGLEIALESSRHAAKGEIFRLTRHLSAKSVLAHLILRRAGLNVDRFLPVGKFGLCNLDQPEWDRLISLVTNLAGSALLIEEL